MENIKPINLCCNNLSRTIPLAFDESMSFLELLYAMNGKLTEVINELNYMSELFHNVDATLEDLYHQIDVVNGKILEANAYAEELTNNLRVELKAYTNETLNLAVSGLRATIENNYTELDNKINNIVVGQIEVYNPTNAQVENINKVLLDIYNANRLYAITCTGFDELELTASEFDAKQLTAYDFDNYSLELLN